MADLSFSTDAPADAEADLLVLPVFQGPEPGPGVKAIGLGAAFADAKLRGEKGDTLVVARRDDDRFAASHVLLVGVGPRSEVTPDVLRRVTARIASRAARFGTVAIGLAQASRKHEAAVTAVVEGMVLGTYRYDRYRTTQTDPRPERLADAWPGATLARLRDLKRRYDPHDVFRHNFSVAEPPAVVV